MNHIFSKRAPLAFAAFFAAAAIASCKSDSTGVSATPTAVAASTSPPASTTAGVAIAGPSVLVTDGGGAPAAGVPVNFAVTAGGGSVQYHVVITGSDGVASSGAWQIGTPGTNTMTATVESLPAVTFTTIAAYGPVTQIVKTGGDNQIGFRNTALTQPLTVRVLSAGGLGIPGQTVTFTVTSGGGSITGSPTVTDANGFATSGPWTMGSIFGNFTTVAQTGTLTTTFTAIVDPCEDRTVIAVGGSANGTLAYDPARCAMNGAADDRYSLATANEAVLITLSSTAFDALLNIWNGAGKIPMATNDNNPAGGTTNSSIRLLAAAGTKTVDATTVTAGATGAYTLSVTSTTADVAGCPTTYIEVGATTNQTLVAATDCKPDGFTADEYIVYLVAGTPYRFIQSSTVAGVIDSYLYVIDPTGAVADEDDDANGGGGSRILYTPTVSGFYTIRSSSYGVSQNDPYGREYGAYTLVVDIP